MTTEQLRRWQERFKEMDHHTPPDRPTSVSVSVSVSDDVLPISSRSLEQIKADLLRSLKESVAHTARTGELWSPHHARTIELIRERDRAANVPNYQI